MRSKAYFEAKIGLELPKELSKYSDSSLIVYRMPREPLVSLFYSSELGAKAVRVCNLALNWKE